MQVQSALLGMKDFQQFGQSELDCLPHNIQICIEVTMRNTVRIPGPSVQA